MNKNKEFKNAPEGTTHKLDGKWYSIDSDLELNDAEGLYAKVFTVGSYWAEVLLRVDVYLQLQPRDVNLWYDFEGQETFAFPTKSDKFLYNDEEACIIGVSADGIFPVLDCADGLHKLTVEDLEFITPIETPEVLAKKVNTISEQVKLMKKFLKKSEVVKGGFLSDTLENLYDKGWRISKLESDND